MILIKACRRRRRRRRRRRLRRRGRGRRRRLRSSRRGRRGRRGRRRRRFFRRRWRQCDRLENLGQFILFDLLTRNLLIIIILINLNFF